MKEGSSTSAYALALQNLKFAMGRSESWAVRTYDSMRSNADLMDHEQLQSLRDLVDAESSRMLRARMGSMTPEIAVWCEVRSWLNEKLGTLEQER